METRSIKKYILLFFPLVCLACSEGMERERKGGASVPLPEQVINNFTVVETKEDRTLWELVSPKAEVFKNETVVYTLKMKFYDGDTVTATLSAEEGRIYSKTKDMSVRGNVVVVSDANGVTLRTESLNWDEKTKKITTDDFIREETEDAVITGYGLEADSDFSKVVIRRGVRVVKKKERK